MQVIYYPFTYSPPHNGEFYDSLKRKINQHIDSLNKKIEIILALNNDQKSSVISIRNGYRDIIVRNTPTQEMMAESNDSNQIAEYIFILYLSWKDIFAQTNSLIYRKFHSLILPYFGSTYTTYKSLMDYFIQLIYREDGKNMKQLIEACISLIQSFSVIREKHFEPINQPAKLNSMGLKMVTISTIDRWPTDSVSAISSTPDFDNSNAVISNNEYRIKPKNKYVGENRLEVISSPLRHSNPNVRKAWYFINQQKPQIINKYMQFSIYEICDPVFVSLEDVQNFAAFYDLEVPDGLMLQSACYLLMVMHGLKFTDSLFRNRNTLIYLLDVLKYSKLSMLQIFKSMNMPRLPFKLIPVERLVDILLDPKKTIPSDLVEMCNKYQMIISSKKNFQIAFECFSTYELLTHNLDLFFVFNDEIVKLLTTSSIEPEMRIPTIQDLLATKYGILFEGAIELKTIYKSLPYYRRYLYATVEPTRTDTYEELSLWSDFQLEYKFNISMRQFYRNQRIEFLLQWQKTPTFFIPRNDTKQALIHRYKYSINKETLLGTEIEHDNTSFFIGFGTATSYYLYEPDELCGSFYKDDETGSRIYRRPENQAKHFTSTEIDQLISLLSHYRTIPNGKKLFDLIDEIKADIYRLTDADLKLKADYNKLPTDQKKLVNGYLRKLFDMAMYLRQWKGPPHPYPLLNRDTGKEHSVKHELDAGAVTETGKALQSAMLLMTEITDLFDSLKEGKRIINRLMIINYVKSDRLVQLERGSELLVNQYRRVIEGNYCIRLVSSQFVATADHYMHMFTNEHTPGFDYKQLETIG